MMTYILKEYVQIGDPIPVLGYFYQIGHFIYNEIMDNYNYFSILPIDIRKQIVEYVKYEPGLYIKISDQIYYKILDIDIDNTDIHNFINNDLDLQNIPLDSLSINIFENNKLCVVYIKTDKGKVIMDENRKYSIYKIHLCQIYKWIHPGSLLWFKLLYKELLYYYKNF